MKRTNIRLSCPECLEVTRFRIVPHGWQQSEHNLECQKCKSQYPASISFNREQISKDIIFRRIEGLHTKYLALETLGWVFNKDGLEILKKQKDTFLKWWSSMDGIAVMGLGIPIDPKERPPKEFWSGGWIVFKAPRKTYTEEEQYSAKWNDIITERGYKSAKEVCNNATKVYFAETETEVHFIQRGLSL